MLSRLGMRATQGVRKLKMRFRSELVEMKVVDHQMRGILLMIEELLGSQRPFGRLNYTNLFFARSCRRFHEAREDLISLTRRSFLPGLVVRTRLLNRRRVLVYILRTVP